MAETEIILKVILNGEGNHDCQKGCQMLTLHHIIHTLVDRGSWYSMFMFFTFAISVLSHSAIGLLNCAYCPLVLYHTDNALCAMYFNCTAVISAADGRTSTYAADVTASVINTCVCPQGLTIRWALG